MEQSDETAFVVDEVQPVVKVVVRYLVSWNFASLVMMRYYLVADKTFQDCVDEILKDVDWNVDMVNEWTNNVCENVLKKMVQMNKPFKYVVTCTIMQRTGAGLHCGSSCYWDGSSDGSVTIRWDSKTMCVF